MIATAPGKLILTGEYAVLDGAPALVMAIDRRVIARLGAPRLGAPQLGDSHDEHARSPFLAAVAAELAARRGAEDPAARAAREIRVDSSSFYDGSMKLGLGSSAAVTVAATAAALAAAGPVDRAEVFAVALAAHAAAQGPMGARGSGADIAAAVHGGLIAYSTGARETPAASPRVDRRPWPDSVLLVPFFTGHSADTPRLVAQVTAARAARPADVDAALAAIAEASQAACAALDAPADLAVRAVISAFALAAHAVERLARATGADLVPRCVGAARTALSRLGGAVKTTGAGGGDLAIGVLPASADVNEVARSLIEAGCSPLRLSLDETGVDTRPVAG